MAIYTPNLNNNFLTGQLLIATPAISHDSFFNKSIVYVMSHNDSGASGLMINHPISSINSDNIFNSFNIVPAKNSLYMPVFFGGPIQSERGFILHSNDYAQENVYKTNEMVSISSNVQILQDIAEGKGPSNCMFALGYSAWNNGQLENEIIHNNWLTIPFSSEIVFAANNEQKWTNALKNLGINWSSISSSIGNA